MSTRSGRFDSVENKQLAYRTLKSEIFDQFKTFWFSSEVFWFSSVPEVFWFISRSMFLFSSVVLIQFQRFWFSWQRLLVVEDWIQLTKSNQLTKHLVWNLWLVPDSCTSASGQALFDQPGLYSNSTFFLSFDFAHIAWYPLTPVMGVLILVTLQRCRCTLLFYLSFLCAILRDTEVNKNP